MNCPRKTDTIDTMPENHISEIQERNRRVELDKAWETSWTRQLIIIGITYAAAYAFMRYNNFHDPQWQALIPTGGYFLSTLTLPPIKSWWTRYKK